MTRLLWTAFSIARKHGILAGLRAACFGYWWGREMRRRHSERMAEIADVNEYHRAAANKPL